MAAKVYLIGAGPGDVELLTLKAVRAIGRADVVLIDDLVNRDVLQWAQPRARVLETGKRAGCRSTPQDFIERQMVRFACDGLCVARVKGGDPFVFGRGGEELNALREAGIEVEVVSGITSGIGVPATLGIPITHRDYASGVTFVTGHAKDGCDPNWRALACSGTTVVIYMGLRRLPEISAKLVAAGMPWSTPAAAIQDGTLSTQRHVISTLGELPTAVRCKGIGSPALVVIGKVVDLAALNPETQRLRQVA